jgi:hypothetical protein
LEIRKEPTRVEERHSQVSLLALPTNNRLGWKRLERASLFRSEIKYGSQKI